MGSPLVKAAATIAAATTNNRATREIGDIDARGAGPLGKSRSAIAEHEVEDLEHRSHLLGPQVTGQ